MLPADSAALNAGPGAAFDPEEITPSPRSRRLARMMRATIRPLSAPIVGRPAAARAAMAAIIRSSCVPPRGTRAERVDAAWGDRKVAGEWVRAPGVRIAEDAGAAMIYIHGSGFVLLSPRDYRGLAARLSQACGLPVFVPRYRLAPEHPFPAGVDDTYAAYRWFIERDLSAERVVVAGDSAGGHFAVAVAAELCRQGLEVPAGLVLFSPFLDPTFELSAARDAICRDPFLSAAALQRIIGYYIGDSDVNDPRMALLKCDPAGLPPILLQTGGLEQLSAEGEAFAAIVNDAGGSCKLQVWPGQIHVFQALYWLVPEARAALAHVARFTRGVLAATT